MRFLTMFQKITKHCAYDASNDVHIVHCTPLPQGEQARKDQSVEKLLLGKRFFAIKTQWPFLELPKTAPSSIGRLAPT